MYHSTVSCFIIRYNKNGFNVREGFKTNAVFFKLSFLDKTTVSLGRQFRELLLTYRAIPSLSHSSSPGCKPFSERILALKINNWNAEEKSGTVYYLPSGTIQDIETGKAVVLGRNQDGSVIASGIGIVFLSIPALTTSPIE